MDELSDLEARLIRAFAVSNGLHLRLIVMLRHPYRRVRRHLISGHVILCT